jgi:hypothetical protein
MCSLAKKRKDHFYPSRDTLSMTYSRDTTTISEWTGQPVSTWSEEWRIECEARALLDISKQEGDMFFNGRRNTSYAACAGHAPT